ncbi:MAG TPA: hypothetical protein PLQ97_11700 [Myxococcota bacterium]|nr:hypothetical protein [Myxococcota bacterium]HQK51423.1 hypothetical protein [Myxococcota bacterium]
MDRPFKRFPWWTLVVAALMVAPFTADAHPRPPRPFAPAFVPAGGYLLPDGVFLVRQGGLEVFWADGCYWTLDPRVGWYRALDWNGPWVLVEPMWVPRPVIIHSQRPGFRGHRGAWYPWARWERHHRDIRPPARWVPDHRPRRYDRDDRWDHREDRRRDGPGRRDRRHR